MIEKEGRKLDINSWDIDNSTQSGLVSSWLLAFAPCALWGMRGLEWPTLGTPAPNITPSHGYGHCTFV